MNKYRKEIDNFTYEVEEVSEFLSGKDLVVQKSTVDNMLDDIETRINNIKNELSGIKGLTEIDNINFDLDKLLKDLY